jgi:hypothetical protein
MPSALSLFIFEPLIRISNINYTLKMDKLEEANHLPQNDYSLKQFAAFANGDPESIREILISFIRSSKQNVKLFRQYIEEENVIMISELSHKMLPLFRQLEAKEIVDLLLQLEQKDNYILGHGQFFSIAKSSLDMIETLLETIQKKERISIG